MYACAMRLFESFAVSDDGDLQINTSLAVDHPNDICTQDEIEAAGCTGCVKFALAPAAHGQNGLPPFLVDLLSAINALLANTPSDQIPTNDELRQAFPFWPFNNLADGVSIKDVLDHVKYCDVDLSDLPDWAGFPTPSPGPDYSPGPSAARRTRRRTRGTRRSPRRTRVPPPLWDNPSCDADIPDVCTLDGECGYIYQCLFPELPQVATAATCPRCAPGRAATTRTVSDETQPGSQYDDACDNAPSDCGQVCAPYVPCIGNPNGPPNGGNQNGPPNGGNQNGGNQNRPNGGNQNGRCSQNGGNQNGPPNSDNTMNGEGSKGPGGANSANTMNRRLNDAVTTQHSSTTQYTATGPCAQEPPDFCRPCASYALCANMHTGGELPSYAVQMYAQLKDEYDEQGELPDGDQVPWPFNSLAPGHTPQHVFDHLEKQGVGGGRRRHASQGCPPPPPRQSFGEEGGLVEGR